MKKISLIICQLLILSLSSCSTNKIDNNKMFVEDSKWYVGKPITRLILDSKFSINNMWVGTADRRMYFESLVLCYSNGMNLKITTDRTNDKSKINTSVFWDYNEIIKDRIRSVELLDYTSKKDDSIKVKVDFISSDSLFIDIITIRKDGFKVSNDSLYKAYQIYQLKNKR